MTIASKRTSYEGVAVAVPVTVPYVRYSTHGAHWFLGQAVAALVEGAGITKDQIDAAQKIWARNTSIILVIFATLVMSISLVRSEQLRVLSNGLLLGGLFTMLYGTGWGIFSGNSTARFVVIAFALLVAIGLGYLKFVRRHAENPALAMEPARAASAEPLGDLDARVTALERKAAAAASALSGQEPEVKE